MPSQDTQMMAPGQMPPDANGQNQGQAAQVPQNQAGMAEKPFKPVYMIELSSNSANYRVMVDAITGQVLKSDVQ